MVIEGMSFHFGGELDRLPAYRENTFPALINYTPTAPVLGAILSEG